VDEFKTEEASELPQVSATSPRWTGAPSIALAHQLNEQCVKFVCELAATSSHQELPQFVVQNHDLWRLLETEARKRGLKVRVAKMGMNGVARALETDESRGFIKVIVDANNEQILGCTVLGIEGGEIMSMLQIAMMGKLPYTVLKEAIFAHPTLAEGLNNIFLALDA